MLKFSKKLTNFEKKIKISRIVHFLSFISIRAKFSSIWDTYFPPFSILILLDAQLNFLNLLISTNQTFFSRHFSK